MAKTVSVAVIMLTNLGCQRATMRFRLSTVANITIFMVKQIKFLPRNGAEKWGEVLKTKFAGAVINR